MSLKKTIEGWIKRKDPVEEAFGMPRARETNAAPVRYKILVLGNCQARSLAVCLQSLSGDVYAKGVELHSTGLEERFVQRDPKLQEVLSGWDYILVQPTYAPLVKDHFPGLAARVMLFPALSFAAYHPDLVYIHLNSAHTFMMGPLGHYNSAIAFWGFSHGLSIAATVELFNEWTYGTLGYFDFWESSRQALIAQGEDADFALASRLDQWSRAGAFMHSVNHPKLSVMADLAAEILTRMSIPSIPAVADYIPDEQAAGPVWPIFPELGARLGVEGHYYFKMPRGQIRDDRPIVMLGLEEFVAASFAAFGSHAPGELVCDRLEFPAFRTLAVALQRRTPAGRPVPTGAPVSAGTPGSDSRSQSLRHPYANLPAHQFWRSAVAAVAPQDVDPVVTARFRISRDAKVATAGSCFAQHISQTLERNGCNYYVAETDANLTSNEARRRNYGVYSARFGNLYTARQLLQLFERAYGSFMPEETAWLGANDRYVDPFRPQIEPDGYDSAEAVSASRALHLSAVRDMFESMDVLIFTLGLTEAWRSKADGAVFPLAPGVAGGQMDFSRYEFVNFSVPETSADLDRFLMLLKAVNPRARTVLTVSPVPLVATYQRQHVLVATTYSKAVLRVAANDTCTGHPQCAYFPSYELITGSHARGSYFEPDLRSVTPSGVDHVMRLFLKHYVDQSDPAVANSALLQEFAAVNDIVCDEEALDRR